MRKKILIISLIVVTCLLGWYKLGSWIAPGNYPHAEEYDLNYCESEVRAVIKELKQEDPSLIVPAVTINDTIPSTLDDHQAQHWYFIYFYHKESGNIYLTWTRPHLDGTGTTFAFIGFNEGLNLGGWKDINRDFGFFENRRIKKELEEWIVNRIKQKLKARK